MTHCWRVRTRLPDRHGSPCRVLARSLVVRHTRKGRPVRWSANSVLVAFEDGLRVVTSAFYVRRLPQ